MSARTLYICLCLMAAVSTASCRVRTTPSKPKHIFGRTSVPATSKRFPCKDGTENPEAVQYLKELANWLMIRNPETFAGEYAPHTFCFAVSEASGINAHADPATGLITVRADMIRMFPDTDESIASILAHELSHVTMQHGRRDPVASDFPSDLDLAELNRRQSAQKTWQTAIEQARKAIIDEAVSSGFLENVKTLLTDRTIWDRILPSLGQIDKGSYQQSSSIFIKMDTQYAAVLKDPQSDTLATWRFLDDIIFNFDQLVGSMSDFQKFSTVDPANCKPENLCPERKLLQTIFNYIQTKLRKSMDNTCSLHLDSKDDPNQYAPWVQWMEQQADEVGFELYLRSGLLATHFTSFMEAMLEADKKFDLCKKNIKQANWRAPRITDEYIDNHPPNCFRYENLTVQEILNHDKEYAPLAAKAVLRTIPELNEYRKAAKEALTKTK